MSEWKKYIGSDEQIAEIKNARKDGYVLRTGPVNETNVLHFIVERDWYKDQFTHYLICNPHPYAGMIKRWADTGQPVYIRYKEYQEDNRYKHIETTMPDWNIPNAEYSFTPFNLD